MALWPLLVEPFAWDYIVATADRDQCAATQLASQSSPLAEWDPLEDFGEHMGRHLSPHSVSDLRFSELVRFRCPAALPAAIEKAASRNLMTSSEYIRRSVLDRLKADGINPGVER